jgi:CheY-like chemotaxis protein
LELAEGLLAEAGGARTLFLTPSGQRGDAARCRELGIDAYLTGAVDVDDMAMAIRAVRDGATDLVTRHWLREHRQPLSILLADDSSTNRAIAVRMLQRAGHQVTAVENGQEAVDRYQQGQYDVVILDVDMPVKDGPTAAREIRVVGDGDATVPIIALTGHVAVADRARILSSGMDDIVPKPFELDQVLSVLDRVTSAA